MTKLVGNIFVACLVTLGAAELAAQDLAITNARIVVGNGTVINSGTVIVRGGKIASAAAGAANTQGLKIVDAKGMTLYYYKPDTATTPACTGGCATNWPPVLFSGSGTPTGGDGVTGKLAVLTGANGAQVTYNGHPLYTFIADKAPGDTVGQGKGEVWFVATPDLATLS